MNAPFPNFAVAQRAYDRQEPAWINDRSAELIERHAAEEAHRLRSALMTDAAVAQDIAADTFECMAPDLAAIALRLIVSGAIDDLQAVRTLILREMNTRIASAADKAAREFVANRRPG